MAKSRVFLDTSVLLTAVLSSAGGSFYILNTLGSAYAFSINAYAFEEATKVLVVKFHKRQDLASKLFLFVGLTPIQILPNPTKERVAALTRIINSKDAPILASALEHSSYFLTLDNDFLQESVVVFAKTKGLTILKPKDFIQQFRKNT